MSAFETRPQTQQRKNAYMIATCVMLGLYVGLMIASRSLGQGVMALGLASAALAFIFSLLWFRALDEMAQRAHYEAWFWGGTIGLLGLPVAFVANIFVHDAWGGLVRWVIDRVWIGADVVDAFSLGMIAGVLPLALGCAIWWSAFWLRRR